MTLADRIALSVVALVLFTMPVFAVLGRDRAMDADVAKRPATALLGYWVRDWLMWVIHPVERVLIHARVSPDIFNYLGVTLGLGAGVTFATGALSLAGWLVLIGGLMDIFDGRVARALGVASARGAFLDSTLDRFTEAFAYTGVAVYFAGRPLGVLVAVVALGGSLLVSYARARGEALDVSCKEGLMQRAERIVLLAAAAILDAAVTGALGWAPGLLLAGVLAVIGFGSLGTALFRTASIARELGRRDAAGRR
ncbi:MAG: CDP-alcohol phosphatidyltransferase family protein [Gemmatimonadota bacterium]|nr:CDP-alcohol phosphatidyltransferase family protein [Gemmatimonadota bacterium]